MLLKLSNILFVLSIRNILKLEDIEIMNGFSLRNKVEQKKINKKKN